MTHPLLVGHFEHGDRGVPTGLPEEARVLPRPVVVRPLEAAEVEAALREVAGNQLTLATIPSDWLIRFGADGVLVGHTYTKNRLAVEFLAGVAKRTGAEIWDEERRQTVDPQQVVAKWSARHERLLALAARQNGENGKGDIPNYAAF